MSSPVIGVPTMRSVTQRGLSVLGVIEANIKALLSAGALPVMIPLGLSGGRLQEIISHLDGLLITGGGDIDPQTYGMETHPAVRGVDPDRDSLEFELIQDAVEARLPFLGICRGLQAINVSQGGTLYSHVIDQLPGARQHDYFLGKPRNFLAHSVEIEPDNLLVDILGTNHLLVNSLHHQGVRQLACGFHPIAFAQDGLIEAFVLPDHPFGLAVQWHPEWIMEHEPMKALFCAFVQAARGDA